MFKTPRKIPRRFAWSDSQSVEFLPVSFKRSDLVQPPSYESAFLMPDGESDGDYDHGDGEPVWVTPTVPEHVRTGPDESEAK